MAYLCDFLQIYVDKNISLIVSASLSPEALPLSIPDR
jgi:hypothetical protein